MQFYVLSIFFSVALVSAQKRHIYLASRSLAVPQNDEETVEDVSVDDSVGVIAHWAVLLSERGPNSPHWNSTRLWEHSSSYIKMTREIIQSKLVLISDHVKRMGGILNASERHLVRMTS